MEILFYFIIFGKLSHLRGKEQINFCGALFYFSTLTLTKDQNIGKHRWILWIYRKYPSNINGYFYKISVIKNDIKIILISIRNDNIN